MTRREQEQRELPEHPSRMTYRGRYDHKEIEMKTSLSGQVVRVERAIWVNRHLKQDREYARRFGFLYDDQDVWVPEGQRTGGVSSSVYDAFSAGSERACADVVITTYLPNGIAAVLGIKRQKNKPFGGMWWMQGGTYHIYRSMSDFVIERAEKECHVRPELEGLIGQFRTCASDYVCSTTNTCYVGYASYDAIQEAHPDKDHIGFHFFTLDDFKLISAPTAGWHWYPLYAFRQALVTMPEWAMIG